MADQQFLTPEAMRELAQKYQQQANRAKELAGFLQQMTSNVFWQSDAATSFKTKIQEYRTLLDRLHVFFGELSTEMKSRAEILETSQRAPV
jgi:uncharacterized protein YukE